MEIAHKQSPGCQQVLSLTGTVEAFGSAADKLLLTLTGLNFSASTVQVTTERVGGDVAARRATGKNPFDDIIAKAWKRLRPKFEHVLDSLSG